MIIWKTLTEIAARDGLSKQAVSKNVKRYVEGDGLPVQTDVRGRVATVSLAHYNHLRARYMNPAKTALPAPDMFAEPEPSEEEIKTSTSFDEGRRQEQWLKVGREKLRQQEESAALVRRDRLIEALAVCGREIQSAVARLPNNADELAFAVSKEGAHSVRVMLREVALKLNGEIADALAKIMSAAPAADAAVELA